MKMSVILVSGGSGTRMGSATPKQYLPLMGKLIARHSFDTFAAMDEVEEIVVVCSQEYRSHFAAPGKKISFADPGVRRQDSVYNGLRAASPDSELICVHDAARPFVTKEMVLRAIAAAEAEGAATVGMPVKFTVKQADETQRVAATHDRSRIWEIQTPQIIRRPLLEEGFRVVNANGATVTDDVSLVETLQHPVKLVQGCYSNIKITTPDDLIFAEAWCRSKSHA